MSGFADYEDYDALGLADLVRRKDVSPNDLLDAAIERVEARNSAVNAVVMPLYDYGRKAIEDGLPHGPFRGVPFLLKDLGGWLAGVKVTRGSRFFADAPAVAADSEHVRRLKRAGLVIFGRTNSCELGLSLTANRRSTVRQRARGTRHASLGARAAVRPPPSERAWSPWRTLPTGSAQSARRRLAAGSWA